MDPVKYLSGTESREEYLSRYHNSPYPYSFNRRYLMGTPNWYPSPTYAAIDFVNNIPGDFKVLFVGETRTLNCKKRFIAGSVFDKIPLEEYLNSLKRKDDLAAKKSDEWDIKYIIVNNYELKRLQNYFPGKDQNKLLLELESLKTIKKVFLQGDLCVLEVI
jgi:hypothetical protein